MYSKVEYRSVADPSEQHLTFHEGGNNVGYRPETQHNICSQAAASIPLIILTWMLLLSFAFTSYILPLLDENNWLMSTFFFMSVYSQNAVAEVYNTDIRPTPWINSFAWHVIFGWLMIWMLDATVCNLVRARLSMQYFKPVVYLLIDASLLCVIVWRLMLYLSLHNPNLLLLAFILVAMALILVGLGIAFAFMSAAGAYSKAVDTHKRFQVWMVRLFFINGIFCYGSWLVYNCCETMAMSLVHQFSSDVDITSLVCLCFLAVIFMLFFYVEMTTLDEFSRSNFIPYFVFFLGQVAIIIANFNGQHFTTILNLILLGVSMLFMLVKVLLTFMKNSHLFSF